MQARRLLRPWVLREHLRVLDESVDGTRVRLNQPLRIRFPVVDGSYLTRLDVVRRCGVESLSLEQTSTIATGPAVTLVATGAGNPVRLSVVRSFAGAY